MCGVAGIVNDLAFELIDRQVHRGPDDKGMWHLDGAVSFGHTRLKIIGLNGGHQPIANYRYMMTYNGEIYNYSDVYENDTVWLFNKIADDGLNSALSQAVGMFAFGLYDKIEQKIHLVVDRMGEKPLYYYHKGDVFAFASSPAALLHLQDKWKINPEALQSYWLLGGVMKDSIWDAIKRVHAAEKVTYDIQSKTIKTERWWAPKYQANTSGIEDLINEAIDNVKVADVPVYIFLSGGIDSTLVASRFQGGNAIHMDGPEYGYAKRAADAFNIKLHVVNPKQFDPKEALTDYVQKSGEPTMAGMIPWITSREASQMCKVAVSANGADELFFGYDRTTDQVTDSQLEHIFRNLPGYKTPLITYFGPGLSTGRWLELSTYVQHDLNRTLDFASMCHSLEVRSPFLDYRLVEMALSIPQKEHGKKEILKRMLRRQGFSNEFLNRPKMGFSLYAKPNRLPEMQREALTWCVQNGFLNCKPQKMSKRDNMYLEAAALGFKVWYDNYKNIIA